MLVFALALLASELGLDLLLGGFAAGLITRQVLKEREVPAFDSKLTASPSASSSRSSSSSAGCSSTSTRCSRARPASLRCPVLRPLPRRARHPGAAALPRVLDRRERLALAFFTSTQLPLVLAITTVARETGHMRASTAASLVGAAVLSTLVYPILGLRLRGDVPIEASSPAEVPGLAGGAP